MLMYLFLAIPPAAWIVAGLNDLLDFTIPNWLCAGLFLTYPFAAFYFGLSPKEIGFSIGLSGIVLLAGFAMFALNWIGAGDAKLLAASTPWIGSAIYLMFLLKVTFIGGAFALLLMTFKKTPFLPVYVHANWVANLHTTNKGMPYGVAIGIGGLLTLPETAIFASMFVI